MTKKETSFEFKKNYNAERGKYSGFVKVELKVNYEFKRFNIFPDEDENSASFMIGGNQNDIHKQKALIDCIKEAVEFAETELNQKPIDGKG